MRPRFSPECQYEFVQVIDPTHVKMRVWERGTGETLACGTGASAVMVACVLNGLTERRAEIALPGGKLELEWNEEDGHVYMDRARPRSSMTASGFRTERAGGRLANRKTKEEPLMLKVNPHYEKLPGSYLFAEIARRVKEYGQEHPDAQLIRLGIGDVTRPLAPAVVEAMEKAAREMGRAETFRGYGPDYGYDFLIQAILDNDYQGLGIQADEVFVSDGAKCDVANVQELFSDDAVVAVTDPVYPVYVDSNAMAGRAGSYAQDRWDRLCYLPCTAENGFVPPLPDRPVDVIYLCYPNNPTGTVLTKEQLKPFVDYAKANGAIIVYDAAYKAFITSGAPRSIYEVEGAKDVAIECCSYSKTAGFTGTAAALWSSPTG